MAAVQLLRGTGARGQAAALSSCAHVNTFESPAATVSGNIKVPVANVGVAHGNRFATEYFSPLLHRSPRHGVAYAWLWPRFTPTYGHGIPTFRNLFD